MLERGSLSVHEVTVASAAPGEINSGIALSTDYDCACIKYTQRKVFWSKTEWCYDGTHIARGHPVMTEGPNTHAYTTATQSILEKATDPIVWMVSGGYQHKHHHDKGLAHLSFASTIAMAIR